MERCRAMLFSDSFDTISFLKGHILKYFIQDLFLLSKCLTYYIDNFVCVIKTYLFVYLSIYFLK